MVRRTPPRPAGRARRDDGGSAAVEFVFLTVLLLVPLVYLLLAVFAVQRAAYAVTAAAREAGRAYVTSAGSDAEAEARARRAAEVALADHGLRLADAGPAFSCARPPCLRPGGRLTVRVAARVPLPFLGGLPGVPAAVGVDAEHVAVVDRYRSLR